MTTASPVSDARIGKTVAHATTKATSAPSATAAMSKGAISMRRKTASEAGHARHGSGLGWGSGIGC